MNSTASPSRVRAAFRSVAAGALLAALSLSLAGCGGSVSSPSPSAAAASTSQQSCTGMGCGTAVISITDQPGDFVTYMVNVDSLTLTRSDGTVVQTVPVTTQVDFTQLVNLSEIVSAAQVPPGRYVSASLTLDYSKATIVVDTGNGNDVTVPFADILGSNGQPLSGPVTVKLSLNTDDQLVITQGTVANLALDFNLLASDTVNLSSTPITVTVNPILMASLAPATSKQIHVRGPLVSVSTSASDYVVNVRPFENADDTRGQVTVATTDSTSYLINGTSYTGAAGLTELATLATGTLTSAYGTWDRSTGTFTAASVLAGSSVAGTTENSVRGTVIARSGDTLTIANGLRFLPMAEATDGEDMSFEHQVTVTLSSSTAVMEQGQMSPLALSDISVGQNLEASGTFASGSSMTNPTLDATSVLLLPTTGVGLVNASGAGTLTVALQSLGNVQASALNFAGTGITGQDATASAYVVALPSAITAPGNGAPVGFTGFVTPFGSAPPDFQATTLSSFSTGHAVLFVRWASPGVTAPFSDLTDSGLLLSQTTLEASTQHELEIGPVSIDPTTLTAGLELLPDTANTDQSFAIAHAMSDTVDTFSTFNDFVTALTTDLTGTTAAKGVFAEGSYATGALTVDHVVVVLNN